jgi:inorganic pyrophosphatase
MTQRLDKADLLKALSHYFHVPVPYELLHGGGAHSGYVQRMEYEKKIQFNKISRPSKHMINKYGTEHHDDAPADYGHDDGAIFDDNDNVDYNVGKQKPKKVAAKKRSPTEVEEERLERAQREQREAKQKQVDELKQLSKLVVECHKMLQKEDNTYRRDVIDNYNIEGV